MKRIDRYRQVIESILNEHAKIPYAHGDIERQVIADRQGDHYLLMAVGWDGDEQIHGSIIHVDLVDGKFWIHHDGTEDGIADELMAAGVPKEHIVLAFHPADMRPFTEFAVA
jgi:hypothetical protein